MARSSEGDVATSTSASGLKGAPAKLPGCSGATRASPMAWPASRIARAQERGSLQVARRNSGVSPWFPLVLLAYPVWETIFSMYRKQRLMIDNAGMSICADGGCHARSKVGQ